jgi:DNA-binding cell septation regulator SpoVG
MGINGRYIVMKIRLTIGFLILWLTAVYARAAPVPCRFGGFDTDSTFEDIGAAYKAADLVVIGAVSGKTGLDNNLIFHPRKVIKGDAGTQITLHAQRVQNTEVNGFLLPENEEFLLFLVRGPLGVFDSVENYNSGCATSFSIRDSNVVLVESDEHNRGTRVPVNEIRRFLISNPAKLIHKDR